MDYTVTNSADFVIALDAAFDSVSEVIKDSADSTLVVSLTEFNDRLRTIFAFEFQEAIGQADFLYATLCECFF
jgi:hypothetical protein